MRTRACVAALTLALAVQSTHAGAPLGKSLKKAMLDDSDRVSVVVRWKRGVTRPQLSGARNVPLFGISGATLSSDAIEALAKTDAVDAIFHDHPIVLEEPRIPQTADELADKEKKMRRTWGLDAIEAHRVHQELGITGKGVRVGIVDTGIDGLHPMFRNKLSGWHDFTGMLSPTADDTDGHGSHVAGTIGGGESPDGVAIGVAPGASLIVARGLGRRQGSTFTLLAAMAYCADPDSDPATDDGARVINCSFGGNNPDTDPLWNDVLAFLSGRNVMAVVAAGNEGDQGEGSVSGPGYLEGSFTVGAVNLRRQRASFSSYSPAKLGNTPRSFIKPDIAAPGVEVLSTREKNVIGRMDGTSMAAPHVAGVVALVCEANPNLTVNEIRELLEATATDLGETGRDHETGAGLINAFRAVTRAKEMLTRPKVTRSTEDLLTEGQRFMVGNNLPAANQRFMRIIQTGDFSADLTQSAMYYLSEGYYRQGNFRGALSGFGKLAEIAPKSPWGAKATFQIGKCYKETPANGTAQANLTFAKADEAFTRFIHTYPDHEWVPTAAVEKANCLASLGRTAEAVTVLKMTLERFPNRPETVAMQELLQRLDGGTVDPLAP